MRQIFLWQNSVSIHQGPLVRELAACDKVTVVTDGGLSLERAKLGWHEPDYGLADVIRSPSEELRQRIIREADRSAIHILSGFRSYSGVTLTQDILMQSGLQYIIQSESLDPRGVKGNLRVPYRQLQALRLAADPLAILTIGKLAHSQFSRIYPEVTRVPFAYFPNAPVMSRLEQPKRNAGAIRLAYIGGMDHRKAPDRLLSALSGVSRPWTLDLVGSGVSLETLRAQSERFGDRVYWHGTTSNAEAVRIMSEADVLVVPSRYDGWGAVVNEAMLVGTKVLCTRETGASELVQEPADGWVANKDSEIVACIESAEPQKAEQRASLAARSHRRFSTATGADYVRRLIDGLSANKALPPPPWIDTKR